MKKLLSALLIFILCENNSHSQTRTPILNQIDTKIVANPAAPIRATDLNGVLKSIINFSDTSLLDGRYNKLGVVAGVGNAAGTVAQLRGMSTSTGLVYFSTDAGGGAWVDMGLNDGQYVDDGGMYIITSNAHALHRINTDGKTHLSWFGAGTNANLTKALLYSNKIVIDEPLSITSTLTIGQGKVIEFEKGAMVTTTGTNKLVIQGKLLAGPYQIFDTAANVKVRPYSTTEIYPEWFGAVAVDNPRDSTSTAYNSTNAFKKAILFTEGATYGTGVHAAKIKLSGWYGINDQLNVTSSIIFEGTAPIFDGTGLRWIGTGDSSKSFILFLSSENGGVIGVGFKGNKSSNVARRNKAAIELRWDSYSTFTQRRMVFERINVSDPIGYFAEGTGWEFENGILCSGISGNNDFHNFKNLNIANVHIGIHTETDQSVDWRVENYGFSDGGIMYQSDLGGDIFGDGWYAANSTSEGVINVGGTISNELRISLSNFSSEHLQCKYFINSGSKVRLNMIGAGLIQVNGSYQTAAEGFALLKGTGFTVDGEYRFQNTRFNYEVNPGSPRKMYVEQLGSNTATRALQFINCTGSKDIYFKFPNSIDPNNSNYTYLNFEGETSQEVQADKKFMVNARNDSSFIQDGSRWLSIATLFNGETEVAASAVTFGKKGISTLSTMGVKTVKATTISAFVQSVSKALPANSVIKGVTAVTADANTLFQNGDYVSIGIGNSERMFGTVAAPTALQYNTKPSSVYITDTAEDIVLKGWREINNNFFTLSGTTLTATNSATFVAGMVGGIVRFTSGSVTNREVLITGYTSSTQVTVSNPDGISAVGELAAVQVPINASKNLMFYITYEQVSKYKNEIDPNTFFTTPAITATSKPVVLNEKQLIYNKIDTTGLVGGAGGGSSQWSNITGGINYGSSVTVASTPLSYSIGPDTYNTKLSVGGGVSTDFTRAAISAFDEANRPVMQVTGVGRQNIFNYDASGSVMALYNRSNPSPSTNLVGGHYAFGATNSAGNLNTISTMLSGTTNRTPSAMSSELQLSYMDSVNTTGGYSQPNRTVTIGDNGFILPTIPIIGASNITTNNVSVANAVTTNSIVVSGNTQTQSLYVPGASTLFGNTWVNSFTPNTLFQMGVNGNFLSRDQTSDNAVYLAPGEFTGGAHLQATNYAVSANKNLFINGGGGNVRIGSSTAPAEKLSVTGNVSSTLPATSPSHLVRLDQVKDSLAKYVKSTDSTTIYLGSMLTGAGTSASPMNVDLAKVTGDGKVLPDADYTITTTDRVLILYQASVGRTLYLPSAAGFARDIYIVCNSTSSGNWLLNGSFVQKGTTGTIASPPTENFINSGLASATIYHLVPIAGKWYEY
jgi:hypothetical protein